ncbi:MAG: DNA translocase FtsK [Bacteroidetes bacterium]|nr:MAG: DNA translocase FtsK [Bacteroidota bacterium]
MAKKRKKGQLRLRLGLNDERIPKLLGLLCLFIATYLFIAFFSYLFTWDIDQDRVLRFKGSLILDSKLEMANWLGRLGAIVSNFFFYWCFGLPSFLLVYLLGRIGLNRIYRQPFVALIPTLNYTIVSLILLSVFLEFIMGDARFPWGGAVGESIAQWLESFVGAVGLWLLIIVSFIGMVIWRTNPNFNELTLDKLIENIIDQVSDFFSGARARRKKRDQMLSKRMARSGAANNGQEHLSEGGDTAEDNTPQLPPTLRPGGSQLAFELEKEKQDKPKSLVAGEAELEIEAPGPATFNAGSNPTGQPLAAQEENKDHSEPYDPTLELSSYEHPSVQLLYDYSDQKIEIDRAELEANKDQIIETLLHYKIEITKIRATIGPTVTLYEIVPAPGVRISKIKNLEDDIALSLSALGIRIIAPIPGKGTIGIEVPNKNTQIVSMREVLSHEKFKRAKMDLPIALGKTISNEVFVADLAKMPHLLVAGATGQGKSVGINAILISLLYKKHPSQVKLVLIDPKKVELFPYSRLEHHFLGFLPGQEEPITTETNRVIHNLNSLCIEMDARYDLLKKASARNIKEYNEKFVARRLNPQKGHRFLPFIVLVIDEFADLIMTAGKEVEMPIGRLAQLARAVGIHLIIATQRPSVNIITGVIKANFPARIAYKVTAKVDSRTILDSGGADQLIGKGDMLLSIGGEMVRIQGAFVDTPEVERVIDFIANQQGYPEPYLLPEFHGDEDMQGSAALSYKDLDDMFEDAARLIVAQQHGSTSMIQRRLKLGYNRAGRIMDQLEAVGIVGPSEGSKAREVLIYDEIELERFLQDLKSRI